MRVCHLVSLFLAVVLAGPVGAFSNIEWEGAINGGYTNNLFAESSGLDDSYSTYLGSVRFYPLASTQVSVRGEYTYYGQMYDLSNVVGGAAVKWIPTSAGSAWSFYVESSFDMRRYRSVFEDFDNNRATVKAALGRVISPHLHVRAGTRATAVSYKNTEATTDADYEQYEGFLAGNVTFLGPTSLDVEAGVGLTNYSFIDATVHDTFPDFFDLEDPFGEFLSEGNFTSFYVSPRLTRSIGTRTGVSVTYTYRHFADIEQSVVLGYATNSLSPWASFFDGSSVNIRVKTYLIPYLTVSGGAGYWDKTYLRSLEMVTKPADWNPEFLIEELSDPKDAPVRQDEQTRVYLGISRMLPVGGMAVEPSLSIDYTHNTSTLDTYDYSSTGVMLGLVIRPSGEGH